MSYSTGKMLLEQELTERLRLLDIEADALLSLPRPFVGADRARAIQVRDDIRLYTRWLWLLTSHIN